MVGKEAGTLKHIANISAQFLKVLLQHIATRDENLPRGWLFEPIDHF
jgi:hypothetical protein